MSKAVLIVDDEVTLADNIATYLTRHGFETRAAYNGHDGMVEFESFKPDVVLLDYLIGDMDGIEVLKKFARLDNQAKVILMTGQGSVQIAVDAMKAGAWDYIGKPIVLAEIKSVLEKLVGQSRMEGALAYYQDKQAEQSGLAKILGQSPHILAVKQKVQQFIDAEKQLKEGTPPAVLITGETGTGKELVARAFHFEGPRAKEAFVEINCAAIPDDLLEAELFGYEKGAFTGAQKRKPGLVESADGGTLFLDEIGEMSLPMQAKLLKLLEDKNVRRVGGLRETAVNVRVIAATNQNLEEQIRHKAFRADLFFRLHIMQIHLPPLRERGQDIIYLGREFLRSIARRYGKHDVSLSPESEELLRQYPWPGNVRELHNVVEHAVLLAGAGNIEKRHIVLTGLSDFDNSSYSENQISSCDDIPEEGIDLDAIERELVVKALERCAWNVTSAAKLLRVSRDTLRYRIEKHQLNNPSKLRSSD